MIYFDNAASAPVLQSALAAAMPFMAECCGNPSSQHTAGRQAALAVMGAREKCAAALGASPDEIIFTSGGTESDNTALFSAALLGAGQGRNELVVTKIEHAAVLNTCKSLEHLGFSVKYIDVDENGYIDISRVRELITDKTAVVSVMAANNEVGTIQPIRETAELCREKGVLFHTDAVQAAGQLPLNVEELGCSMLSLSAHKFGGLRGAGLLYVRRGVTLRPLIYGGGQESGLRGGTENVAAIVAMGTALEEACRDIPEKCRRISEMRDMIIRGLLEIPRSRLLGGREKRLCGNVCVAFEGVEGESLVLGLDLRGVCASSGSACSSGKEEPSHVLRAMNVPQELQRGSLRLSLGAQNTREEASAAVEAVKETVGLLRGLREK